MFVFIMTKKRNIHILDRFYNDPIRDKYKTACGKFFRKNNLITLASDDLFGGICKLCENYHKQAYVNVKNQMKRSKNFPNDVDFIIDNDELIFFGPKKFQMRFSRVYPKFSLAKRFYLTRKYRYYG